MIRTPRLLLDHFRASDADALFAYRSDPRVARFQGWVPATTEEATAFVMEQSRRTIPSTGWQQLAIRGRDGVELHGDIGIRFPDSADEAIEIGVSVKPSSQGRGYAREAMAAVIASAFGAWGFRRLVCSVDPRNSASIALCRSLGLRQEAHHVESLWFRDEWVDDVIFALLAREWDRSRDTGTR